MKLATKPSRKTPCQDEDRAHHQRQGGGGGDQGGGLGPGRGFAQRARAEDGERRGRADAEGPRGAEGGVHHHRQQRRVEADLDGKPGDGGVRHRLGDHDRGGREAGQDVGSQPGPLISRQPVGGGEEGAAHPSGPFRHAVPGPHRPKESAGEERRVGVHDRDVAGLGAGVVSIQLFTQAASRFGARRFRGPGVSSYYGPRRLK